MTPYIDLFQRRTAAVRKNRKMTLDAVAQASGLAKSYVWELEKGNPKNLTVRAVYSLAGALGVSPVYLLGLDAEKAELDPLAHQIACLINAELNRREGASHD